MNSNVANNEVVNTEKETDQTIANQEADGQETADQETGTEPPASEAPEPADADGSDADGSDADDVEARLEALRAEREVLNDRLLRTAAELQNVRRRAEEERARLAVSSKTRVLRPMLSVMDDFERSLAAADELAASNDAGAPEAAFASLREGVEMVYRKLADELARLGVERIEAEGQPFDEHAHEALMQQPAPEGVAPGTVLQEVQKGYRLGERVLRHSKVVVSS